MYIKPNPKRDICGPLKIKFFGVVHYLITFIND